MSFRQRADKTHESGVCVCVCVCVSKSYFDSSIGGVSHSLQQLVILWIKRDSEGTVNDSPCKQTEQIVLTLSHSFAFQDAEDGLENDFSVKF